MTGLPVIAHCGECRYLDVVAWVKPARFVCKREKRDVYDEPSAKPRKPPVPPPWCPLRGEP